VTSDLDKESAGYLQTYGCGQAFKSFSCPHLWHDLAHPWSSQTFFQNIRTFFFPQKIVICPYR